MSEFGAVTFLHDQHKPPIGEYSLVRLTDIALPLQSLNHVMYVKHSLIWIISDEFQGSNCEEGQRYAWSYDRKLHILSTNLKKKYLHLNYKKPEEGNMESPLHWNT